LKFIEQEENFTGIVLMSYFASVRVLAKYQVMLQKYSPEKSCNTM